MTRQSARCCYFVFSLILLLCITLQPTHSSAPTNLTSALHQLSADIQAHLRQLQPQPLKDALVDEQNGKDHSSDSQFNSHAHAKGTALLHEAQALIQRSATSDEPSLLETAYQRLKQKLEGAVQAVKARRAGNKQALSDTIHQLKDRGHDLLDAVHAHIDRLAPDMHAKGQHQQVKTGNKQDDSSSGGDKESDLTRLRRIAERKVAEAKERAGAAASQAVPSLDELSTKIQSLVSEYATSTTQKAKIQLGHSAGQLLQQLHQLTPTITLDNFHLFDQVKQALLALQQKLKEKDNIISEVMRDSGEPLTLSSLKQRAQQATNDLATKASQSAEQAKAAVDEL